MSPRLTFPQLRPRKETGDEPKPRPLSTFHSIRSAAILKAQTIHGIRISQRTRIPASRLITSCIIARWSYPLGTFAPPGLSRLRDYRFQSRLVGLLVCSSHGRGFRINTAESGSRDSAEARGPHTSYRPDRYPMTLSCSLADPSTRPLSPQDRTNYISSLSSDPNPCTKSCIGRNRSCLAPLTRLLPICRAA